MKFSILYKQKTIEIQIDAKAKTVMDLKAAIKTKTKISELQQQLSYTDVEGKKIILDDNLRPLQLLQVPQNSQIMLKNLGSQISWAAVFYVEYLGPLIIFPILYFLGKRQQYTQIQTVALAMGVIHYAKRIFETAFVHVFSRDSMPFMNLFKNSTHYWVFFALFNGIEQFFFPKTHTYSYPVLIGLVSIWFLFQFCNYKCHCVLSSFRKVKPKSSDGQYENAAKRRGIPKGWGFQLVSCANYFWQILGWVIFTIVTRGYAAGAFTIISAIQMILWAKKKHSQYRKQFPGTYPQNRKAIIPFLI